MDNWKELPNNRKLKKLRNYSVILPDELPNTIPLNCPVCHQLMRDHDDVLSFQKSECCVDCELLWASPNKKKWAEGWRPSPQEVIKEINKRKEMPSYIYQVK